MRIIICAVCVCFIMVHISCTEEQNIDPIGLEKGFVAGKVTDTQGNPIEGADIVVNNSQFYNNNILGQTDEKGQYRLEVEPGSWYVQASIHIQYDNQHYVLDLDPDNSKGFAGSEGAVRNFQWKISGAKPTDFGGSGYYGGSVEIVGGLNFFDVDGVELTLKPVAPLVDGSTGQIITQNPSGDILEDIPIGKYEISARYVPENRPMKIRIRNKDQAFGSTVTDNFEPAYPGATGSYKITVEVE